MGRWADMASYKEDGRRVKGGATHAEKEIVVPTPLWLIFID